MSVAGIDSHKDTLAVAVVDDQGGNSIGRRSRTHPADITHSSDGWGDTR
jgi:hypothetical protein